MPIGAAIRFAFGAGRRARGRRNGAPDIPRAAYYERNRRTASARRRNNATPRRTTHWARTFPASVPEARIRRGAEAAVAAERAAERQHRAALREIDARHGRALGRLATIREASAGFLYGAGLAVALPYTAEDLLFTFLLSQWTPLRGLGGFNFVRPITVKDVFSILLPLPSILARRRIALRVGALYRRYLIEEMEAKRLKYRTGALFGSVETYVQPIGTKGVVLHEAFPDTYYFSPWPGGQYAYVLNGTAPKGRKAARNFIRRARFRTFARARGIARVTWHRLR